MKMIVPKMHWRKFQRLAGGLKKDPRFALENQDVENGYVKFRSESRLRLLQQILEHHNTGALPVSTIKRNAISAAKMEKLGFNMKAFFASLESVRGPDSNGFYTSQCPSCARRGGDSDKDHLAVIPEEGVVHCFSGCNFYDVIDGYYNKEEKA